MVLRDGCRNSARRAGFAWPSGKGSRLRGPQDQQAGGHQGKKAGGQTNEGGSPPEFLELGFRQWRQHREEPLPDLWIREQFPEGLLIHERVEQFLVLQGRGEQHLLFGVGQDAGRISAEQLFRCRPVHGSHLPPIDPSNCCRQR